jgi:hypothetical protein
MVLMDLFLGHTFTSMVASNDKKNAKYKYQSNFFLGGKIMAGTKIHGLVTSERRYGVFESIYESIKARGLRFKRMKCVSYREKLGDLLVNPQVPALPAENGSQMIRLTGIHGLVPDPNFFDLIVRRESPYDRFRARPNPREILPTEFNWSEEDGRCNQVWLGNNRISRSLYWFFGNTPDVLGVTL